MTPLKLTVTGNGNALQGNAGFMNDRVPDSTDSRPASESAGAWHEMVTVDMSCPDCGHPSIETLEFPDGRVTYCPQCGYRGLDDGSGSGQWADG